MPSASSTSPPRCILFDPMGLYTCNYELLTPSAFPLQVVHLPQTLQLDAEALEACTETLPVKTKIKKALGISNFSLTLGHPTHSGAGPHFI